ncbi:TPA: gfo/Idh/MocA family oxidoreductase, partial [Candidatus Bathyarchaeota archaeon]|nr:gfo/Idh/MocA family oxidoreductase [Candidatus Bathyarchaeota archaeon]
MKEIGWGVIGCGGIADRRTIPEGIIPAEGAKLVAVMSPHE